MFKQFFLREANILWAIILNAIVIFILYFPQLESGWPKTYYWLDIVDHLFILLFVIEAAVKISVYRPKVYFADGWNIFDFVIAIASFPALLSILGLPMLPHTSVFKVLRMFRLIRIFRFMHFVPRMEQIMTGLTRAAKASVFVLLALILLNFIIALFTCHFYGDLVPEYFGNPLTSCYYIFQMFTVEGWNEIPNVIAEAVEEKGMGNSTLIIGLARLYFILVVLVGGIFGMSLANAVFVDEMTMDNNQDIEKKMDQLQQQIAELKEIIQKNNN